MSSGRPKGGKNRNWTSDEKERLILEYYASEKGYKAFAVEHGISKSLFCGWIKKYQENGKEGLRHQRRNVSEKRVLEMQENSEIQSLKLIIAEQQIEIEKLKKELAES